MAWAIKDRWVSIWPSIISYGMVHTVWMISWYGSTGSFGWDGIIFPANTSFEVSTGELCQLYINGLMQRVTVKLFWKQFLCKGSNGSSIRWLVDSTCILNAVCDWTPSTRLRIIWMVKAGQCGIRLGYATWQRVESRGAWQQWTDDRKSIRNNFQNREKQKKNKIMKVGIMNTVCFGKLIFRLTYAHIFAMTRPCDLT